MKSLRAVPLILLGLAASAAASSHKKTETPPPADGESSPRATAEDGKKRIEAYLAQRTKKLQDAYAARQEFSSRENLLWEEFWGKDRDARKTFELRTARQMVDLFSTLETLDPKDHASTIADFEHLRATMVKSFEAQQKQKMQEFFAARQARWNEFAAAQEKDRAAFAADADAAWQDDKNFLKSIYSPEHPAPARVSHPDEDR
ncbi:MAG: hypothetical protein KGL74_08200 [Elusimicrobia bacterium]|nr:hypothetical protein [Elusimicrobiota bacterium]